MLMNYTGYETPNVFAWQIAPAGRVNPTAPRLKTGPRMNKQQQAVCALSTPQERRELLAALAAKAAAKLDISSSTQIVS